MGRRERTEDHFRKRLLAERKRRKWSQADVAKMLRDNGIEPMHATTIAKIEAGDRSVRIDEATGIADLFDTSLDALLGRRAGLDNDLTYALQALQDEAQKFMLQVGPIATALRDRAVDLFEFQFDGRDTIERECKRVFDAVTEAEDATFNLGAFVLPPETAVRLRQDLVKDEAIKLVYEWASAADDSDSQVLERFLLKRAAAADAKRQRK